MLRTSRRMVTKLSSVWDGMQRMVQLRKSMKSQAEHSSIRFPKAALEDAHRQATTSADRTTVFHGRLMASTSPRRLAGTTKVSTSGRAILTLITMVGTPRIKATVRSTSSQMMAHSGKILMAMGTATTLRLHSTLTNVHSSLETRPWTDSDARMLMGTGTQTKTTGLRATKSNGSTPMVMVMVTITSTM